MKGKSAREKGHSFERRIAADLTEDAGRPVKRNLAQTRDGGCDIRAGRLVVECKRRHRISMMRYWDQVERAAGRSGIPDAVPVVVMREDQQPEPVAMLSWRHLRELMLRAGWLNAG